MIFKVLGVLLTVFTVVNGANYTYLQYKFNRDYLGFNSYDVEWTADGTYTLSSTVTQYVAFNNLMAIVTISVPENNLDFFYQKTLFNTTLNMCDLLNSVVSNFVMKIFLSNIERYSDYRLFCPFRSGRFELLNYPGINSIVPKLLQPFLIPSKFQMVIIIDAEVFGQVLPVRVAYMKAEGVNTGLAGLFG